jgi:hypothetical protein
MLVIGGFSAPSAIMAFADRTQEVGGSNAVRWGSLRGSSDRVYVIAMHDGRPAASAHPAACPSSAT